MDLAKQCGTLFVTLCVRTSANQMIFQLFCKNRRAFWFRRLLYCRLFIDAGTSGAAKVTKVSFVSALLFFIVLYRGNLIFKSSYSWGHKTSSIVCFFFFFLHIGCPGRRVNPGLSDWTSGFLMQINSSHVFRIIISTQQMMEAKSLVFITMII